MYSYSYQAQEIFVSQFAQTVDNSVQLTQYCLCTVGLDQLSAKFCSCESQAVNVEEYDNKIATSENHEENKHSENADEHRRENHATPKRRSRLPEIEENLFQLLQLISSGVSLQFAHNEKSARGLHNGVSNRRSQFIGVLKNGNRWQVLINDAKGKKYIGTFISEKEAAIVHDFYSIGINGTRGKTNFSYDNEMIQSMINSYFMSNKHFDASPYANLL